MLQINCKELVFRKAPGQEKIVPGNRALKLGEKLSADNPCLNLDQIMCEFPFLSQGSGAAGKGDFLFSSDHLIEMATKLYRTTLSQTKQKLNIEISDEYVLAFAHFKQLLLGEFEMTLNEKIETDLII